MKVAAAQISCTLGDFDANLCKVRDFAARAKVSGAELVVFPEMIDTGYSMPVIQNHAKTWKEGAIVDLQKIAKENCIAIVAGISDRDGDSIFNAQVLVSANGEVLAKYRKTHLVTAAPLDERVCLSPGGEFVTAKIDNYIVGLSICYDLRFPEMARTLFVKNNANVIVNSSAWPAVRAEHLRILALARAVENQSYFVVANRVGTDDGVTFCGGSLVVDPSGKILTSASADREELIEAKISEQVVAEVRSRVPVFEHRRSDLY
ncbi:MAG TPA: nitrilase-related carbon-nitrogen hydrolase [Chthoniobacterales bacterium]|jgi:predicted amidohydrolase|nr:nitrilase-related carbon-nitrogen hydrolase [Chthoniobacterales bacterium]